MRLKDYDERDGKRVWLSESEIQLLLENVDDRIEPEIALRLMARSGLRRQEVVDVEFAHLVEDADVGHIVRVWDGKGGQYREVPVEQQVVTMARTLRRAEGREPDSPIVQVAASTLYEFVRRARGRCWNQTKDEGWQYVGPHDLRRSWGVRLLEAGVLPSVVMDWGGWNDWETFRNHYLAEFSPEIVRRERAKLSWLGGQEAGEEGYAAVDPRGEYR